MATAYEIPLTPEAQVLTVELAGKTYAVTLRYYDLPDGGWVVDIADSATGAAIINGLPLVTGCDLLEPFPDKGLGGGLVVLGAFGDAPPTFENIGDTVGLYFVPADASA